MKLAYLIAASLLLATPINAFADEQPLSDAGYLAASHCLAYADLPALRTDTINVGALRDAVAKSTGHSRLIKDTAANDARSVRISAGAMPRTDATREQLRAQRSQACGQFVANGLVQLETATPAS
ncbi:MAG TPA: hypothetical protein VG841_12345 [Caulobacterales bacterium]|nr:hypothetical protein [Caulobacterales bacterium]